MTDDRAGDLPERGDEGSLLQKPVDRRGALGMLLTGRGRRRPGAERLLAR